MLITVICLTHFHIYLPNPGQTTTASWRPSSWCYQGLVYIRHFQYFVFMLVDSWFNVNLSSYLQHFLQAVTTWDKCLLCRWAFRTRILWPSLVGIPWFVLKPKILSWIMILLSRILFVAVSFLVLQWYVIIFATKLCYPIHDQIILALLSFMVMCSVRLMYQQLVLRLIYIYIVISLLQNKITWNAVSEKYAIIALSSFRCSFGGSQ